MSLPIRIKTTNVVDIAFNVVEDTVLVPNMQYDGEDNGAIQITNNRTKDLPPGFFTGTIGNLRCFISAVSGIPAGNNEINWVSLYGFSSSTENLEMTLYFVPL